MKHRCLVGVVGVIVTVAVNVTGSGTATAGTARSALTKGISDSQIRNYISDVQDFWARELSDVYGNRYRRIPDNKIRAYTTAKQAEKASQCARKLGGRRVLNNAFYCQLDKRVGYDSNWFSNEAKESGPLVVGATLAHEWGHVIQDQTGTEFPNPVFIENQADCFAGAWLARVSAGKSKRVKPHKGDLDTAVAGFLNARDPIGKDPTREAAHGNGFDRVNAIQLGVEGGARRCSRYDNDPPLITEIPFTNPEDVATGGNLPYTDVFNLTEQDLNAYWSTVITPYNAPTNIVAYNPADRSSEPDCPSLNYGPRDYENAIFYCQDNDTIAYDRTFFRSVYGDIGDFGIATLLSNAWASAMQARLGEKSSDQNLGAQADCYSGSWAGSVPIDDPPTTAARGTPVNRQSVIILSPGDLDEVIKTFLLFSGGGSARGSAFNRIEAFRIGFSNGEQGCASITSNS